jgi:hypothetical protein
VIVADAYKQAQAVKGEGDAKAAALYAEAFGKDPAFAQFYRSLDAYKASFTGKSDVMVVDPVVGVLQGHARQQRRLAEWGLRGRAVLARAGHGARVRGLAAVSAPGLWRRVFSEVLKLQDGQIRFFGLSVSAGWVP